MRAIAVINQKGGVGKTTTSINVAAELAFKNKSVLLVDLDSQGNATSGLSVDPSRASVITDIGLGEIEYLKAVVNISDNFDLLPGGPRLASFDKDISGVSNPAMFLNNTLKDLDYDYVILDCPPSLGQMTINALAAATDVLIPVQAEYYALEGLGQLLQLIEKVRTRINPDLNILGILITMFDKRNTLAKDVSNQLAEHFGDKVFNSVIPRNVRLAEAPSHGQPIREYDKWSRGARAYKSLASEIVGRCG